MATSRSTSGELTEAPDRRENWWVEVAAVTAKDFRSEMRTRSALGIVLAFAFVVTLLLSFTQVTRGVGLTQIYIRGELQSVPSTMQRAVLISVLYWTVLYFAAVAGLPRVFTKEEETGTAAALRLMARPSAIFAGKLLFNGGLQLAVAWLVLPLFLFFIGPHVANWPSLAAHVSAGALATAAGASLLGAMAARASGAAHLMAVLSFPALLPVMTWGINGTAAAMHGTGANLLIPLVSYVLVMVVLSGWLFEQVWTG